MLIIFSQIIKLLTNVLWLLKLERKTVKLPLAPNAEFPSTCLWPPTVSANLRAACPVHPVFVGDQPVEGKKIIQICLAVLILHTPSR